ncbi:DUF4292 domain-containing protein [Flavobacterium sp.]|uniref:DUF4292 domain-containing protein n=1 Tax=Flavobacterium sp. TaxID=239 RepID=UPI0028BDD74B|nr:DUF4292 domain-containing protein [Flavobacterium sp.]
MQKRIVVFSLFFLFSCKSKQNVVAEQTAAENTALSAVVQGHYANKKNFKTANFRASARYEDSKQSQNVTAEVRIKKDEKILIIVRFFGITMAKALITPDQVSYYEKMNGKYFQGNYKLLSNWLGTDLNFQKVQNLLLGQSLDDLTRGKYQESVQNGLHVLQSEDKMFTKQFMFEGANFLLKKESLMQKDGERSVEVQYPAYKESTNGIFPTEIVIGAEQKDKVSINIVYNNVTFNEDLSFTYDVPEGYEQLFID